MPLVKKAQALDPYQWGGFQVVFFLDHYRKGEYEQALARTHKMDPQFYRRSEAMAMANGQLGRKEEAQAAVHELLRIRPDFEQHAWEDTRNLDLSGELAERIIDGLRKAGLEIPDEG